MSNGDSKRLQQIRGKEIRLLVRKHVKPYLGKVIDKAVMSQIKATLVREASALLGVPVEVRLRQTGQSKTVFSFWIARGSNYDGENLGLDSSLF